MGRLPVFILTVPTPVRALDIGKVVPDSHLQALDDREILLADAKKSHRAVVVLSLTICPYSNCYNDLICGLASEFKRKGVLFLGVNFGRIETAEEVKAHALKHGHTFPIAKDPQGRIASLLSARRTPEVFVLDHDGRLRYHGRVASKISSPDLKNALDVLLQGRPIKPAETRAFGCAIPRG